MLSICLLTRNAEAQIPGVLKSVAPLGFEILVGDTGSTDSTITIVESLGARVVRVPWEDDFSKAQNHVVALATHPWVFWINPDEELLNPSQSQFDALLKQQDALAFVVRVQEMARPNQLDHLVESWAPRITRRIPQLRYQGRLHPHFDPSLQEVARQQQKQVILTDLVIRHHGYLSTVTDDKLRWAIRLLELELKDRPNQLHYMIEYGRNLLRLNDPRGHEILGNACRLLLASLDTAQPLSPSAASLLEYILQVPPEQSQSPLSADQAGALALRYFPKSPPLIWFVAQKAFLAGKFDQSARLLESLLEMGQSKTYDHSAPFDPGIMHEKALLNLGKCYYQLGDLPRAQACFEKTMDKPGFQEESLREIKRIKDRLSLPK